MSFFKQKLRKIRTILAGDTGDECDFICHEKTLRLMIID